MSNKTSNETIFCNDFKILKKGSTFRATFFQHVGRTQSLCSPQSNESFGFEGNLKNEKVENNKVDFGEESEPIMTNINYTRKIITPPPGFDDIQPFITRNQEINEQNYEMPKSFSMAKRNLLLKAHTTHQSDGDLSQYINPDLLLGRRSSLLQNDQMNKKIRQKEAYKTAMCQAWLQGQNCAFGEQCSFAHGETDLQPLPLVNLENNQNMTIYSANRQNPKYKTRVCENYTTTGICPFGNRCFFIHPQPNSKIEDVIEYKESLDQRTRELEGEALIQQDLASIKNQITRKSTNKKLKRFRKLESCGNFFTQFQLQQQAQLQQQIQIESQAIITATVLAQTAKTLETKAIELEIQKQQIQQQQQLNNYENVQTNSSANSNFGFFSKGMPNRFAALKNSSMTGSMPLIYSSNSNLYKHPNSIERRSKAVDSAILFSNSKHQFLQNEEISKGYDEPTLSDHDSSGPHTPPNFYQNPVVVPKCCRGNQWGSLTSSHNKKHESTFWSIDSPRMKNNHQNQVLPSFSLFGPENFNNSFNESGEDLLNISSKNVLSGSYYSTSSCSGKRSPIMGEFMSSLLSGRRSSHTPLLMDESGEECAQAMLNMLLEPGNIRKISLTRANRSAEVLSTSKENTGELSAIGTEKKSLTLLKLLSPSSNNWEGCARSTGALDEQFESTFIEQFGPPPGFERENVMVIGGEKWNKEIENKFQMSIKHEISIKNEISKNDDERSFVNKNQIVKENCFLGRNTIEDIRKTIKSETTTDIKFNKATISKFADDHDCSSLDNSTLYGSSLPTTKSLLNSAIDSSLLTQMTSNKGSLGTNLEKIWTSSLPEIDQNSNDNNEKTEKIENEEKVENEINSININESKEELEGSITTLFYSDIVKKTKKHEQLNEIVGQQIEIIGIPYLNNNNNNHLNKPGEQTWAMRAIKKSCLGNKFSSSPSLSPSTSLNSGEQNAHNTE